MNFSQLYTNLGIRDVIDISLVAYLIYNVIKLLRNSRAIPVLLGLILVFFLSIIARLLQLHSLDSILSIFISTYLAFTVIIILQPELRRIFYILGQTGHTRSKTLRPSANHTFGADGKGTFRNTQPPSLGCSCT